MGCLSATEGDSVFEGLFRDREIPEEEKKPETLKERLHYLKKALGYSTVVTGSSLLLYQMFLPAIYKLAFVRETQCQRLHMYFDGPPQMEKSGSVWEQELYEARILTARHYLYLLIWSLGAGSILYYNWKADTLKKSWCYLRKTFE